VAVGQASAIENELAAAHAFAVEESIGFWIT
jgi:hypothetical protein